MAKAVVSNFTLESISEEFQSKGPQKQGIKCAIKEILGLPYPLMQTCANLLRDLLSALQQEAEEGSKFTPRPGGSEDSPLRGEQFESMDLQRASGGEEPA